MDYSKLNTIQLIKKETELYLKGIQVCIELVKTNELETEKGKNKVETAFNNIADCKIEMSKRGIPVPDRYITQGIILKIANE